MSLVNRALSGLLHLHPIFFFFFFPSFLLPPLPSLHPPSCDSWIWSSITLLLIPNIQSLLDFLPSFSLSLLSVETRSPTCFLHAQSEDADEVNAALTKAKQKAKNTIRLRSPVSRQRHTQPAQPAAVASSSAASSGRE
ncbi:hypothetical protein V8C26DRAFT_394514 [Trichoderma gracile]